MKIFRPLFLSFLLAVLATGSTFADQRLIALGADGDLYQVETGLARDLFPGVLHTDNPVLALTVTRPDAPPHRLLVPGTEGAEVESVPSLFYEEVSGASYLIWESRSNYIHSEIKLASFAGGEWSTPIELTGEFFSLKTSPSLAITRDSYITFDEHGQPRVHPRTIYHTIWWEEAAAGERVVYSPVVLVDGAYIGWNPLFVLNDLGFAPGPGLSYTATDNLVRAPSIQAGQNTNNVVVGLVDPASEQLIELEISVVAGELSSLAHEVAEAILEAGERQPYDVGVLADRARGHLIDFGARLRMHPGVIDTLAGEAFHVVALATPAAEPLSELADRARGHLIDFGARMADQGLNSADGEKPNWPLEFPGAEAVTGTRGEPLHSVQVKLTAVRPIPRTNPGAPSTLYLSRSGEEALVAWQVGNTLFYQESQGSEWGPTHRLKIGPSLDLERAHGILEQRIRNR